MCKKEAVFSSYEEESEIDNMLQNLKKDYKDALQRNFKGTSTN